MERVETLFDRLQNISGTIKKHFNNLLVESLLNDEEFVGDAANFINNKEETAKQVYNLAGYIRDEYVDCEKIDCQNDEGIANRGIENFLLSIQYGLDIYEIAKAIVNKLNEKKAA